MKERRKSKRLPVNIRLRVDSVYNSGDRNIIGMDEEVNVINISKTGIGFISHKEFPVGSYFNAEITIDEEKRFYSVLRIVRNQNINDGYIVGCEFVGLADVLSECIDLYENEVFEK